MFTKIWLFLSIMGSIQQLQMATTYHDIGSKVKQK